MASSSSAVTNGHRPTEPAEIDETVVESAEVDESIDVDVEQGSSAAVEVVAIDEPTSRWKIRRRSAIALVVAALLGTAGYVGWLFYQVHARDVAATQARDAAEKYAMVLTSIDTKDLDKNFADVLAGSTGEFKNMYAKSSVQLRQLLVDNKAAAHGTVVESAVQSATPDTVVVLLFVDQSITNTAVPDPRIDRSRIKMTMDKVDGKWLAEKVELP